MHRNTTTPHKPSPTHHQQSLHPHFPVAKLSPRREVVDVVLVRHDDYDVESQDDGVDAEQDQGLCECVDGVEVQGWEKGPGEDYGEDVQEEGDADTEEEGHSGWVSACGRRLWFSGCVALTVAGAYREVFAVDNVRCFV